MDFEDKKTKNTQEQVKLPEELSSQVENNEAEEDIGQRLKERVEQIEKEIINLQQEKEEAEKNAREQGTKLFGLWKQKIITSQDEFQKLSAQIEEGPMYIFEIINQKNTERSLARIDYLNHVVPPDLLRRHVSDLRIRENLDKFQGSDIQAGGSNAQGVFEIENGEFVLIKKSKASYKFEGALPYLMQEVGTERIPRVLEVFETDNATYKVMEKASGKELDKFSEEQIAEIPQEHFDQFIQDLASLENMGLQIDPSKRSNFFYDSRKGFSIIDIEDFHSRRIDKEKPDNLNIKNIRIALIGGGQNETVTNKIQKAFEKIVKAS